MIVAEVPLKLRFLRWLDSRVSTFRKWRKERRQRAKWGARWRDYTRSGRTYTHGNDTGQKGWEWHCPNCHEYSLSQNDELKVCEACKGDGHACRKCKGTGTVIVKASMRGCYNCMYRPGDPE